MGDKGSRKSFVKSPFNFQMALSKPSAYLNSRYRDQTIKDLVEEDLDWVREDTIKGILWCS